MTAGGNRDDLDWLEAGPPPPVRPRAQRTVVVLLVVVVAVVVGVTAVMSGPDRQDEASRLSHSPTPSPVSPVSAPPTRPPRTPDPRPQVLTQRAGFLARGDWDLFARSSDTVFRIDLRTGLITATGGVSLQSGSPTAFVAGPAGVVIRPLDVVRGFLVPDGRPARRLAGLLANGGQVLPGPADRLWVGDAEGTGTTMTLTDVDGDPTGTMVRSPGTLSPDGSGGLLLTDVGGVWEVRADLPPHRVTRGVVNAVGPHHYLIVTCDAEHRCSRYRYDKRTRQRTRLGLASTENLPYGTLSPDGRFAALASWGSSGEATVSVQDLDSDRVVTTVPASNDIDASGAVIFSPDSRTLIGLRSGRIFVRDLRTGRTTVPDLGLPQLIQITARIDR